MPNKCLVPGCGASYRKNPSLNFFSFVRNEERKMLWINSIQKGTSVFLDRLAIDINDRICSLHFNTDDIITEVKERGDFKFLKKDAVPTIFKSHKKKLHNISNQNKCRLCLKETGFNHMLISDAIGSCSDATIIEAVNKTFDITLKDLQSFPQRVCLQCYNQVLSAYNLKSEILKSNQTLRDIFEREINKTEFTAINLKSIDEGASTSKNPLDEFKPLDSLIDQIKIEKEDYDEDDEPLRTSRRKIKHEPLGDANLVEVQLTEFDQPTRSEKRSYKRWSDDVEKPKKKSDKNLHKSDKKICKKCHFVADSVLILLKHIDDSKQKCSDYYEPTKECYICHRKFMLDVKKREHVRRDHIDYTSKDCPHCIRSRLKTPTAYELHVRQHFAQPDFLCTNCGKGFFKKELYEMHMRQHDETFWMFCDHCLYKCKIKNSMSIHLKHHFDIRPYVCDRCSKSFHKSNALSQHIFQVHKTTNKGCYRCVKCNYCFLHRRDIIRHNVYCEGQSKNPINCPRVKFQDLDPNCVIKELLDDEKQHAEGVKHPEKIN